MLCIGLNVTFIYLINSHVISFRSKCYEKVERLLSCGIEFHGTCVGEHDLQRPVAQNKVDQIIHVLLDMKDSQQK